MNYLLVFGQVVVLSIALPLSVIAALGFRGSPFGKVVMPIPVVIVAYILADGLVLILDPVPVAVYAGLSVVGLVASAYAVANAVLLLTERRMV